MGWSGYSLISPYDHKKMGCDDMHHKLVSLCTLIFQSFVFRWVISLSIAALFVFDFKQIQLDRTLLGLYFLITFLIAHVLQIESNNKHNILMKFRFMVFMIGLYISSVLMFLTLIFFR